MTDKFQLNPKQNEALELFGSVAEKILLYGGARSAKTFVILRTIIIRALAIDKSRHAVLRFRFSHVKASVVYDTFPKVMELCFPDCPYDLNKSDWFVEFPNKSQIWFGGLDDKERTEKILGNEYCLNPDSLVLMADLTWRRAEDVRKDDEIIAFPESLEGHMKLIRSTVEFNKLLFKKRYRVVTNKGSTIVSEGHKFVAYYDDRRVRNFRPLSWRKVEDLSPGDKLRFACEPWTTDKSYDGGWLAGMYDGEGWVSGGSAGVAQNKGVVLDKLIECLKSRRVDIRKHKDRDCCQVVATGLWASIHAIGMLRPLRLLKKASVLWEGRNGFNGQHGNSAKTMSRHGINVDSRHVAEILSIEELPEGEVRAIQTSSKTLISDGFLSHNCTIFLNETSQIAYNSYLIILTRLAQKCFYEIKGKKIEAKLKLFCDENPPNKGHWTYRLFISKLDPETKIGLPDPEHYAYLRMNPMDNKDNLPEAYIETLKNLPKRKRDRFFLGLFTDDTDNALWTPEILDKSRVNEIPEGVEMVRIVVAVDPSGADDEENAGNDEIGIGVAGLGTDGNGYIFEDLTLKAGPATWGKVVASAYERHSADRVVAEANFGGAMVEFVVKAADPNISYKAVTASRGKVVRAEPISALHEVGKIKLVGDFPDLEDELCGFTTTGYIGDKSPNRADWFVWAMTELFPSIIKPRGNKKMRPLKQNSYYRPHRVHER